MKRKTAIRSLLGGVAGMAITGSARSAIRESNEPFAMKGNINHSVCSWTYSFLPLDELCITAKKLGLKAIDLLPPKDWPVLQKHGLTCSMCYTAGKISLTQGWNDPRNHDSLIRDFTEAIPLVAQAGYKNLICFSGNRNGMDDATGLDHCAEGLKRIMPLAEQHKVVIQMELFNSKVDHKDYMCDKSAWGVALCRKIGSENFKLLYDIYHMQINEGDVIRTIRNHHSYFGHYHTAGVPGRNDIDDMQELYYPAIMRTIYSTE
ncbi:MAG: hydroxypyruvate isomerase family protein, partial [Chitinophagaceae bacterium]